MGETSYLKALVYVQVIIYSSMYVQIFHATIKNHSIKLVVLVAQVALLDMHHLPHLGRNLICQDKSDVLIQCNIPTLLIRPVKGNKGTRYVLFPGFKVLLLPGPPGAVEVRVVDVEDGVGSFSGRGLLACLSTMYGSGLGNAKGWKLTARPLVRHMPI